MPPSERFEGGFCYNKTIDPAVDDCPDKAQPGQRRENAPTGAVLLFTKILFCGTIYVGRMCVFMKTGLVLEGGAMRGLFSAGVTDVMMENGISFNCLVGVSAGAAFGCNYKSGQNGRAVRYNTRFAKDKRYCSTRSLIRTGDLFGAEFCYHTVPNKLDVFDREAFNNSSMEFYVVCTDCVTGLPVYKRLDLADDTCFEWIRASASMPLVSKPVELEGKKLLDGGMSDSIPLRFMIRGGFEKNVVILTQPRDFEKQPASLMPLMKLSLQKYPNLLAAMKNRHENYNRSRRLVFAEEKAGRAFVICPDEPLPIGRIEHDPDKMLNAYNIGRAIGERRLSELKEFLNT